jgi:hypothetical protein
VWCKATSTLYIQGMYGGMVEYRHYVCYHRQEEKKQWGGRKCNSGNSFIHTHRSSLTVNQLHTRGLTFLRHKAAFRENSSFVHRHTDVIDRRPMMSFTLSDDQDRRAHRIGHQPSRASQFRLSKFLFQNCPGQLIKEPRKICRLLGRSLPKLGGDIRPPINKVQIFRYESPGASSDSCKEAHPHCTSLPLCTRLLH